ncbi:MAG TPA: YraN family protein [Deltaproteobacteria bacterium]|nr:MAG: YraN family protein [Deltaproteobacteria bacterium GWA2_55_82]OGQ63231.1 MAG: YraN family protein [Deltaproteobacteria bacterium RIFCSPLOWO2_02_FULL_55_12]OIJ73066.1 MAG: YraN family protein [Deltaproteobacteria bacterium GWC2_55_46]HBG47827.1 YraN family protein [Deltaproteobacteria bacterium]HCY11910.1 YraN family protein [Deltaproteobacteria bacterium]
MNRIAVGKAGEDEAAGFLERHGYRILERNFRCRYGEIDIIARDGKTIVFVEVKTRGSDRFGPPGASVDGRKQRKMTITSSFYLEGLGHTDPDIRFDVVCIEMKDGRAQIEHIQDAFEAGE